MEAGSAERGIPEGFPMGAFLDMPEKVPSRMPPSGLFYSTAMKPICYDSHTYQREITPENAYTIADSTGETVITFNLLQGGSNVVAIEGKDMRIKGSIKIYTTATAHDDFLLEGGWASLINKISLIINGERHDILKYNILKVILEDYSASYEYRQCYGSMIEGLASSIATQTDGAVATGEPVLIGGDGAYGSVYNFDIAFTHPFFTAKQYFPILGLTECRLELTLGAVKEHFVEYIAAPADFAITETITNLKMIIPYVILDEGEKEMRDTILLQGLRYSVPNFKVMTFPLGVGITEYTQPITQSISSARYLVLVNQINTTIASSTAVRSLTNFNLQGITEVYFTHNGRDYPHNHIFPSLTLPYTHVIENLKIMSHISDRTYAPRMETILFGGATDKALYKENRDVIIVDLEKMNEEGSAMVAGTDISDRQGKLVIKSSGGINAASTMTVFICYDALFERLPESMGDTIKISDRYGVEKI
jgi:hypothetical protein